MVTPTRRCSLTQQEAADFERQGFIGPFQVYEPDEMAERWNRIRRQLLDRSKAIYPDNALGGVTNISNYDRHLDVNLLSEHICREQIVDRVVSILGSDVLCWRTEFFPKYMGDEGTDWHQADTFANASGTPQILWPEDDPYPDAGGTLTAWTAFTASTLVTGALQLIPGTHRTMYYDETKRMEYNPESINAVEKQDTKRGFFGYDYRQLQVDPDWSPDESSAVSFVMEPGQCLLFWSTLMHASLPNTAQDPKQYRMGFVARYVPTRVRIYPDTEFVSEYGGSISLDNYGAVMVAGQDEYGYNKIVTQNRRGYTFPVSVPR